MIMIVEGTSCLRAARQVDCVQHWEGFHSQDSHAVVVLGATNRRSAVDPAALRRCCLLLSAAATHSVISRCNLLWLYQPACQLARGSAARLLLCPGLKLSQQLLIAELMNCCRFTMQEQVGLPDARAREVILRKNLAAHAECISVDAGLTQVPLSAGRLQVGLCLCFVAHSTAEVCCM